MKFFSIKKFTILIFFSLIINCNFSYANNVKNILMGVHINEDGSAYVIENWVGDFTQGTEVYIPIDKGEENIKLLSVSMTGQQGNRIEFEKVDNWNVNSNFEEKSYKCGINKTEKGIEICFGLSKYGYNSYSIHYVIEDFVKRYQDYDGFNYKLINGNMNIFPTKVSVNISVAGKELNSDNARVWGFGFDGVAAFNNGMAIISTNRELVGSDSVIAMMRFNQNLLSPKKVVDKSFDSVVEEAFRGSSYSFDLYKEENKITLEDILMYMWYILFAFVAIWTIYRSIKRKRDIKKFYNSCNYFRDIPNGGDMFITYSLLKDFSIDKFSESNIIAALIIKLVNDKSLEDKYEVKNNLFFKEKKSVSFEIKKEPEGELLKRFYSIIVAAAGKDNILQKNEMEKYFYNNPESIKLFYDFVNDNGHNKLNKGNCYNKVLGNRMEHLNEKGKEELSEVFGLKKYLEEFSLIGEREVSETEVWDNYLIYAALFGIADKVLKQFKDIYPDRIYEFDKYENTVNVGYDFVRIMNIGYRRANFNKLSNEVTRSVGSGGFTSIGGGGGFSGGGDGGGVR